MVQKSTTKTQANLFYGSLINMLDVNDPLVALADAIEWSKIVGEFSSFPRSPWECI